MRAWCSKNYVQFWDEMAPTYADWFEPYKQTLEWKAPFAKWFMGGKINVAYNAVDRHANPGVATSWPTSSWESRWAMCARSPTSS